MITIAEPIDFDTLRIRHEFISAPDLRASVASVAADLQIAPRHALAVLESLVSEGFLERTADDHYIRVTGALSK
jgi:DNA-binding IclR family transcriptional regulator